MVYYPDDFLMDLLFSATAVEGQQVSSFWYTKLLEQFYVGALWQVVVVATCAAVVMYKMANSTSSNQGKKKIKTSNNIYSNMIKIVRNLYRVMALNLRIPLWFSKLTLQIHLLCKEALTRERPRASVRPGKCTQGETQKDVLSMKTIIQVGKKGRRNPAPVLEDDVARKHRSQLATRACDNVPKRITKSSKLGSDQKPQWPADEGTEENTTEKICGSKDLKLKASVAQLKGSKNAKIVWGAAGPMEVDQFKGKMCIYPKTTGDSMPCSETFSEVIYESDNRNGTEIVTDFRQQKAMFIQVNKSDKRIVIDTVTGTTSPTKTFLSKYTSVVNVDEATSDLMTGNLKVIRNKYSGENKDTRRGDFTEPALPRASRAQNQSTTGKEENSLDRDAALRLEPLSIQNSLTAPENVKVYSQQDSGASIIASKAGEQVDSTSQLANVKPKSSLQTELATHFKFDQGSKTRQSMTSFVSGEMKNNKAIGLLNYKSHGKLKGIINSSLFSNKTKQYTASIKNNEQKKTIQNDTLEQNKTIQNDTVDSAPQLANVKPNSSLQTELATHFKFDQESKTRQSMTSFDSGEMMNNKEADPFKCKSRGHLKGIINTSLFSNKSTQYTASIKNNEQEKTIQNDTLVMNTLTDNNNWKNVVSDSTDPNHNRVLDIEKSDDKFTWSSKKHDERSNTHSLFPESFSSDSRASETFDTLFNVSEYSLRETLESYQDCLSTWHRGKVLPPGKKHRQALSCTSDSDVSLGRSRSSTSRSADTKNCSLEGGATMSYFKPTHSDGDVEKTSEDSFEHIFQYMHEASYEAKKTAFAMLESKPPPGKPKILQDRNVKARPEKGFKPSLDETDENPAEFPQFPKDKKPFFDTYKARYKLTDNADFNSPEECYDKIGQCHASREGHESSSSSIHLEATTKKRRCSHLSIFGGKLPRRIVPKDNILQARCSAFHGQKSRVLKAEYRKASDDVSSRNIKSNIICTCGKMSQSKPLNSQRKEDESFGTSTIEVFDCLIHSADRLNTIYANSMRKQKHLGAIRNKLNNSKYRPYFIPRFKKQKIKRPPNHIDAKRSSKENSSIQPYSVLGALEMKVQGQGETTIEPKRDCLSNTADSSSGKRCRSFLSKVGEKPFSQRSTTNPKISVLASNARLLQQRPLMSQNSIDTMRQNKVDKVSELGFTTTLGANKKERNRSRELTLQPSGEPRVKEESSDFKRRVSDSIKSFVLKVEPTHRNKTNKTAFVTETVSENLTITKNICMIESLQSESRVETRYNSVEKGEDSNLIATPSPTQLEQQTFCTEVPTPTRSDTVLPQAKLRNTFATSMNQQDHFTPEMQIISPVKRESIRALSEITFYGRQDQLKNIPLYTMRALNYSLKDETNELPLPEVMLKGNDPPTPSRKLTADSTIYFPQKRWAAKSGELNAILSPEVSMSKIFSPEKRKITNASQPEFKGNCDYLQSSGYSQHKSEESVHHFQKSQPINHISTIPLRSKVLGSKLRVSSRIPRYVSLRKSPKKSINSPKERLNSLKLVLKNNECERDTLDLHRKVEMKTQEMSLKNSSFFFRRQRPKTANKVNYSSDSRTSPTPSAAILESQREQFQKITVENSEKGIKSVLPLLMNHAQESIIIITPEKKVKHLNVVVKAPESHTNSKMLVQNSPFPVRNKKEFSNNIPESKKEEYDVFSDTGPETDNTRNITKVKENCQQMLKNTKLNIESGENLHHEEWKDEDTPVSRKTSVRVNKKPKTCNPKLCRSRGTYTRANKTCDIGDTNVRIYSQQHTMKMGEHLISRQKLKSIYDVAGKEWENSKSTANDSSMQKDCAKYLTCKINYAPKQSPSRMRKENGLEKKENETPKRVNAIRGEKMIFNDRVTRIGRPNRNEGSKSGAKRSKIPRLTKKTETVQMKIIGEEAKVSHPQDDVQKKFQCPIKILACEDYRLASIASDLFELELSLSKKKSQEKNSVHYETLNKCHLQHKITQRMGENAYRKRIPVLKNTSVAKQKTSGYAQEEVNEIPNSGKHNSINKKKSPKRRHILENKFTIKLDIGKPTACYPVCGNNEKLSLNDTLSEINEKGTSGASGKSLQHLHRAVTDGAQSTNISKDESLFKRVPGFKTGKQRPAKALPTKWKMEVTQKTTDRKVRPKVDRFLQNPKDGKAICTTHKGVTVGGHKFSIDKKTDSLMKGMILNEIQQFKLSREMAPNEGKRTSLRRKKSTDRNHDMILDTPTTMKVHEDMVKDSQISRRVQSPKQVSFSSTKLGKAGGCRKRKHLSNVDKEVNPAHDQQLPRKSQKIIDSQRPLIFSDQSPIKGIKKFRQDKQSKFSLRHIEPLFASDEGTQMSPENILSKDIRDGVLEPHSGMGKLLRTNSADFFKGHLSSDMDCSTSMPTTEAEMRVPSLMDKGPLVKKLSLTGTGAEDARTYARESHDILKSDHFQGMLKNIKAEEQEVLIQRLKNWIENRMSQTKNESDASTEAIVGDELEHVFQVIISSLDANTLQSVYSKIQPKLEHLDKIIEVDEKSAENINFQNASPVQDVDPGLHKKALNETENNRKSAAGNTTFRKIATKKIFQKFQTRRPTIGSRQPVRESNLVNYRKPKINGTLFQDLVNMQQRKFGQYCSNGLSPKFRPERRVPGFQTNFCSRKITDPGKRLENGSGNAETFSCDYLKRLSSPVCKLRNSAFSSDFDQLTSEFKCRRLKGEDNVYRHTRFPSVSSISCYDLGATYVASYKSPLPIQTTSYIVYKKKGAHDDSVRSLPKDLIIGTSTHSERWTPLSIGRLSDYIQEFDLRASYQKLALGSKGLSEDNDSLFREVASNSSADVILSWLARTPEIDISEDRAMKRVNSSNMTRLGSTHILTNAPLPVASPQDNDIITCEKGSPWLENLEQKSVSPLNLTDLDTNLQVLTSKHTSLKAREGHSGNTVNNTQTSSVLKSSIASLAKGEHASANETSRGGTEKGSLKNTVREMEKVDESETRVSNDAKDVNRKEQNESFNNRVGRLRYDNQKRQLSSEPRQLAFIMPNSNTKKFSLSEALSTAESDCQHSLVSEKEPNLSPANRMEESLTPEFIESSIEFKQTYLQSGHTLARIGHRKSESLVDWTEQKENDPQNDSNPNCLDVTYSWRNDSSEDSGARHERAKLSLDDHLNTCTYISDGISPGKSNAKKWIKSEASTLSQVSFDWYKPSTVNPGQSSIATGQSLKIGRQEDNDIDVPENNLQETKEKSDEFFEPVGGAFQTSEGKVVSKCNSNTKNALSEMPAKESNKRSPPKDQRDAPERPDYLNVACCERPCDDDRWGSGRDEQVFERKVELDVGFQSYKESSQIQKDTDPVFINSHTENAIRGDHPDSCHYECHGLDRDHLRQSCTSKSESSKTSLNRIFDCAAPRQWSEGPATHRSLGPDRSMFTGDNLPMRSVISRYEHADTDRHASFTSSREKSKKCSLSFSSTRSSCQVSKSEHFSRSGYRYKTINTEANGASTAGCAIPKRAHSHLMSFNANYAQPMRTSCEAFASHFKPFSTSTCFVKNRPSSNLCKSEGAEAVSEPRPPQCSIGRKHALGFSYLFSESFDRCGGADGLNVSDGSAAGPTVVRTRRPKMNTMVGQIVKMFEKRLQFRPVQN